MNIRQRTPAEQLLYCAEQLHTAAEHHAALGVTAFGVAIILEHLADQITTCGNTLHDSVCTLRPGHGGPGDHIDRDGNNW